jgi:hypothetical protein
VVPEVPPGQPSVAGSNIRLGDGAIDVSASQDNGTYTTRLAVHGLRLRSVQIGYTLPARTSPGSVRLDGQALTQFAVRDTNRGVEVTAPVSGDGPHTLVVTTA